MALSGKNHAEAPKQPFCAHPAHPRPNPSGVGLCGGPSSAGVGQLRAVSLMPGHCWGGSLPMELLLPKPTAHSPSLHTHSHSPKSLSSLLPEQIWSWPPGKEVSVPVGSLRRVTAVIP